MSEWIDKLQITDYRLLQSFRILSSRIISRLVIFKIFFYNLIRVSVSSLPNLSLLSRTIYWCWLCVSNFVGLIVSGWPGGIKWIHRGDRKLYSRRLITLPICYSTHVHRGALKSQARKSQSCCITVRPTASAFGYLARLNIFQHFVMRNFFWKDSPLISQFIPIAIAIRIYVIT